MSAPVPSWYDLLGVAPDATPDEIRAAWRGAIADLDPTDRRFGVLNQAAEVLLDPATRAEHDAELAASAPEPAPEPAPDPVADQADADAEPLVLSSTSGRRVVPGWLLIGLAALTLVVAGVAGYLWVKVPSDQSVEDSTTAARSAAERAVVPVLSYDAQHLDESKAAAEPYLTSSYRAEYDKIFNGIIAQNAPETGTVVKADLIRSSVVRSGADRVQVFVLVNQTRTNKKFKQPQVYKNWVTMTMEDVDGNWLVDGMDT